MKAISKSLPTIGEISRSLGCSQHRVEYVITSRNLTPITRAGGARVFSEEQVKLIALELQKIEARRKEGRL